MRETALCARVLAWTASVALFALPAGAAPLSRNAPLSVRILYDNSGSMYPGYRPPGSPDRLTREQLGVHFFHQSPQFANWLDDFAQRQRSLNVDSIGMWTFTSDAAFSEADLAEVHPVVPLAGFRAQTAVAAFPARAGRSTYLTEALTSFSRDFTGLIWLVTDNIVETQAGEADAGVQRFFETLAQSDEFRSVHLFKYPFEENGQMSALAVYGILVSRAEVPGETLAYYDARFPDLLPGHEHLKLKNLAIEPMTLHADLQLVLADRDKGLFEEGQHVHLGLEGEIRSHLTQHTVTAGHYELAIASPFVPERWAQRDLGAASLSPDIFDSVNGDIREEIPPNGMRRIQALLHSDQPVAFTPKGLAEWLRLAWSGATVRYTGTVRMSLSDVNVRLQRQQMAGIFGIDHASSIFAFQDVTSLSGIQPSVVPLHFALRTGSRRTAILLAFLTVMAAVVITATLSLSRKQTFRIAIANASETVTALRRLGTHNVTYEGKLLGRLTRGLMNGYAFHAVRGNPEFTLVPTSDGDSWDVKFTGGPSRRLSIKAEGGRTPMRPKPSVPAARAGPAPPPPAPPISRTGPPPSPPPRLRR